MHKIGICSVFVIFTGLKTRDNNSVYCRKNINFTKWLFHQKKILQREK